jgi:hypothetical protein
LITPFNKREAFIISELPTNRPEPRFLLHTTPFLGNFWFANQRKVAHTSQYQGHLSGAICQLRGIASAFPVTQDDQQAFSSIEKISGH